MKFKDMSNEDLINIVIGVSMGLGVMDTLDAAASSIRGGRGARDELKSRGFTFKETKHFDLTISKDGKKCASCKGGK